MQNAISVFQKATLMEAIHLTKHQREDWPQRREIFVI